MNGIWHNLWTSPQDNRVRKCFNRDPGLCKYLDLVNQIYNGKDVEEKNLKGFELLNEVRQKLPAYKVYSGLMGAIATDNEKDEEEKLLKLAKMCMEDPEMVKELNKIHDQINPDSAKSRSQKGAKNRRWITTNCLFYFQRKWK